MKIHNFRNIFENGDYVNISKKTFGEGLKNGYGYLIN